MIPHSRPRVDDEDLRAVARALEAGHLSQGEEVARLEADLSAFFDGMEAVVVGSGTAALYLALVASGLLPGEKVVIPSYTCNSLYAAAVHAGGSPVCVDCAEDGLSVGPQNVGGLLDGEVRAVIAPHTCGFLADVEGIAALGRPVIEDCAQAVGGYYADGSRVGTKGDVAVLSFYATKLLPAGEGGACLTRNRNIAGTIRDLRNCDERPLDARAFNFKMGDLNAALARAKLQKLPIHVEERARIAEKYDEAFGNSAFRTRAEQKQAVCFRYVVETDSRVTDFLEKAKERGILCRRPLWRPLHHALGGICPRTEWLESRLASVPLYPGLTEEEIGVICGTLPRLLGNDV
ncbi:MAG: DegT/DnrJ/EryC1/StrS aminotransferase family protein [Kiritimatiellae bacterium]|nr:DegT/DnrJ/EryC1/StrS aminotransferase family protein [Kiritimatiellia bacterium]